MGKSTKECKISGDKIPHHRSGDRLPTTGIGGRLVQHVRGEWDQPPMMPCAPHTEPRAPAQNARNKPWRRSRSLWLFARPTMQPASAKRSRGGQRKVWSVLPFASTPWPITLHSQWAQRGAIPWIAHSKVSRSGWRRSTPVCGRDRGMHLPNSTAFSCPACVLLRAVRSRRPLSLRIMATHFRQRDR